MPVISKKEEKTCTYYRIKYGVQKIAQSALYLVSSSSPSFCTGRTFVSILRSCAVSLPLAPTTGFHLLSFLPPQKACCSVSSGHSSVWPRRTWFQTSCHEHATTICCSFENPQEHGYQAKRLPLANTDHNLHNLEHYCSSSFLTFSNTLFITLAL